MLSRRLQQLTQLPEPPFLRAQIGYDPMGKGYQAYKLEAVLGKGGAAPAIAALTQESARIRAFGFSQAELDAAKKSMLRTVEVQYAERDKITSAAFVKSYVAGFLNGEVQPGVEDEYRYTRELMPEIGLADVQQFARATLPANAPRTLTFKGKDKPDAPAPSQARTARRPGGGRRCGGDGARREGVCRQPARNPAAGRRDRCRNPGRGSGHHTLDPVQRHQGDPQEDRLPQRTGDHARSPLRRRHALQAGGRYRRALVECNRLDHGLGRAFACGPAANVGREVDGDWA